MYHAPRNTEDLRWLGERHEKMQVIEQRGTYRSSPATRGGGRKRDTMIVIYAQERNAGAMGHSPIAEGGNPPDEVAARRSVPSRSSPEKTEN